MATALQLFQRSLAQAIAERQGHDVGQLLRVEITPKAQQPHHRQHRLAEAARTLGLDTVCDAAFWADGLPEPWDTVAANYVLCVAQLDAGDVLGAYNAARTMYKAVLETALEGGAQPQQCFFPEALCSAVKALQATATRCDKETLQANAADENAAEGGCRADAANRLSDALTAALRTSQGIGVCLLQLVNVRLAQCLQLHSAELASSTLQQLQSGWDHDVLLPLESFPRSQVVTFWYLSGVQELLSGRLDDADRDLASAFSACHRAAVRNKRLILCRLVATALVQRDRVPSKALLASFGLSGVYGGLVAALRCGDLAAYDSELARNAGVFARWGVYLPLERARSIVWRNILRRAWLAKARFVEEERAAGRDSAHPLRKPSVLPLQAVLTAARLLSSASGEPAGLGAEEVECMAATLIAEGRVRGYVEPRQHLLVLSSTKPFPIRGAVNATTPAATPTPTPPAQSLQVSGPTATVTFDMTM